MFHLKLLFYLFQFTAYAIAYQSNGMFYIGFNINIQNTYKTELRA